VFSEQAHFRLSPTAGALRNSHMPSPAVEHVGEDLYLVDTDGRKWRVHDVHFTNFKSHRVPLGSAKANTRYFVAADGTKRVYTFGKDTRRDLSLETLLEQLAGAGYVGVLPPFDASSRDPR
jgi:hypothetical protein